MLSLSQYFHNAKSKTNEKRTDQEELSKHSYFASKQINCRCPLCQNPPMMQRDEDSNKIPLEITKADKEKRDALFNGPMNNPFDRGYLYILRRYHSYNYRLSNTVNQNGNMTMLVCPSALFCKGEAFLVVKMGGRRGKASLNYITKPEKISSTMVGTHFFEKMPQAFYIRRKKLSNQKQITRKRLGPQSYRRPSIILQRKESPVIVQQKSMNYNVESKGRNNVYDVRRTLSWIPTDSITEDVKVQYMPPSQEPNSTDIVPEKIKKAKQVCLRFRDSMQQLRFLSRRGFGEFIEGSKKHGTTLGDLMLVEKAIFKENAILSYHKSRFLSSKYSTQSNL